MTELGIAARRPGEASQGLLARHPLISFFVIAYLLAWLIEIPMDLSTNGVLPALPKPAIALCIAAATFAPAAAAFIMTGATEGKAGVVRLLRRCVRWRVGVQWYLFV